MIELNTREAKRKWFAVNKIWFIVKEINPPFQRQTNCRGLAYSGLNERNWVKDCRQKVKR